MAEKIYLGAAETKRDQFTLTVDGTIEATDVITVKIGTAAVSIVAGSTVAATVAASLLAALTATTRPRPFAGVTWSVNSNVITGIGPTDGRPVSAGVTAETTETGGGAADDQTFVKSVVQAGTGPYDYTNVANWSGGSLPANGDTIHFGLHPYCPKYNVDGQDSITPAAIIVHSGPHSGLIVGLDAYNATDGYAEYLPTHLEIKPTNVFVGSGEGTYVPKLMINTLDAGSSMYVYRTEQRSDDGKAPINWLTTASSTLADCRGAIDIGTYAGQAPVLGTVTQQTGGNARIGKLATTVTLNVLGGVMDYEADDAPTTINVKKGATLNLAGNGNTITTLNFERGSTVNYRRKGGTITNVIGAGVFDASQAVDGTFTNVDVFAGIDWRDPNKVGTYTNGIDLNGCGNTDQDVKVDVGNHVRVTPGAVA